jgi:hypothetical protein
MAPAGDDETLVEVCAVRSKDVFAATQAAQGRKRCVKTRGAD